MTQKEHREVVKKALQRLDCLVKTGLDSIEALDRFFTVEVMPRLTILSKAERLPDLPDCPLWRRVDELWGRPDPDAEAVKAAMLAALSTYERKG